MSFSRSSARKRVLVAAALAAVLLSGCSSSDGREELASAVAAYEVKDFAKADRFVAESLKCDPKNPDTLVWAVRVKLALDNLAAAETALAAATEVAGGDLDVRTLAAEIAFQKKDYAAAEAGFAAIANDAAFEAKERANGYAGLGVVKMTQGDRDAARIALLLALRLDPKCRAARYNLGHLYANAFGYPEAAIEQYNVFVRLDAVADQRVQEVTKKTLKDLQEEIRRRSAELPGASKRDSTAAASALARAEKLAKAGDTKSVKAAVEAYDQALKADPLSYQAALALAKALPRVDATAAGKRRQLEAYKTACALRPDAIRTHIETGALAASLGQNAIAVEAYSRALAADPTNLGTIDGLIRALRKTGGDNVKIAAQYQAYRDALAAKRK